jgi:hypothetical protein
LKSFLHLSARKLIQRGQHLSSLFLYPFLGFPPLGQAPVSARSTFWNNRETPGGCVREKDGRVILSCSGYNGALMLQSTNRAAVSSLSSVNAPIDCVHPPLRLPVMLSETS